MKNKPLYTTSKKSVGKDDRTYLSDDFKRLPKIVDAGNIQPRGRINSYWLTNPPSLSKYASKIPKNLLNDYTNPERVREKFGLRSIEFGNWLNDNDRIEFLVSLADCLHLIKSIYKIKSTNIGKGILSVSLGARGKGGKVSAHYEGGLKVINITKPHVANGSFMHEFAHHVDYYFSSDKYGLPSGGKSRNTSIFEDRLKVPIVKEFESVFEKLYIGDNEFTSFALSMERSSNYLASRVEVWARVSEVYFRIKRKETNNVMYTKTLNRYKHEEKYPSEHLVKKAIPHIDTIYKSYFSK